ncbi:hypothetical protein AbraIFM66951_002751 [Aspergillus brasiliensis]|uniref:Uncharacterized protein n=1 Tax=Aspergillus brasiliensis TaxID=319629 RepID=A0A9W5Z2Q9_9EURO|nr:hypothetical protein AbraCBS73388_002776 [Aspergillus brasiliensis]GKZ42818.1 hypothetical protein AbraIFM66951_002751 [Aspergillus brasiliensis]
MDVLSPPEYPPVQPSEYPQIPTRTPPATLEKLHASCVSHDIQKFREILDSQSSSSEGFDICDFSAIMIEATKLDAVPFIRELLDRGLPMDPLYALEAVKLRGKNALEVFLQQEGWNINQPISELKPPVLGRGGDARKGQLLPHAIDRHADNIAILRLLIDNGADVNATIYENHYPSRALFGFMGCGTPPRKAAELGKVDVVRYLVSKGANLSIRDANGRTAREYAQLLNQWDVIRVLEKGN